MTSENRVRLSWFPHYSWISKLLATSDNAPKKVSCMINSIWDQRGKMHSTTISIKPNPIEGRCSPAGEYHIRYVSIQSTAHLDCIQAFPSALGAQGTSAGGPEAQLASPSKK
jgi:hypothetical protein